MNALVRPEIRNPAAYVPPSAIAFGALGADAQLVGPGSPLPVRDAALGLSLIERLNREGDLIGNAADEDFTSFTISPGAGTPAISGLPSGTPSVGRAVCLSHLLISCTTPIVGRYQVTANPIAGAGSAQIMDMGFSCGPNFPVSVPMGVFMRSSLKQEARCYIRRWLDPEVAGTHYFQAGVVGWHLADAINFDARKVILCIGDSLWNGTGPSDVTHCIPWLINRFYRDRGVDSRYILKAYSGSTTTGHERFRQAGRYDFPQVDAIFYQLGTNDAGQGYPTATSLANIAAFIGWKQKQYPEAKLVVLGPPPVENASSEAALAAIRTAAAAHISALADPHVLFCDLGDAFNPLDAGNYVGSDTPGGRVHPGDAGLDQVWQGGHAGFAGLEAWLAGNLPTL